MAQWKSYCEDMFRMLLHACVGYTIALCGACALAKRLDSRTAHCPLLTRLLGPLTSLPKQPFPIRPKLIRDSKNGPRYQVTG